MPVQLIVTLPYFFFVQTKGTIDKLQNMVSSDGRHRNLRDALHRYLRDVLFTGRLIDRRYRNFRDALHRYLRDSLVLHKAPH
jgi:hypothetical protein